MKKRLRSIFLIVIALLILPLAGCGMFSSKAPRNPPAKLVDFDQSKTPDRVWSVSVGSTNNYIFTPATAYDAVYAAGADGDVVKVEAATGQVLWRKDLDMELTAGVGTDGTTVVVVGARGALVALTAEGQEKWRATLTTEALSSPVLSQGLVIVRTMDNVISAFNAENGEKKWSVPYRAPALMLRSAPGIATVGPTALVAMPGGRMISMMLDTGAVRWEIPIGEPRGATELERIADMAGTPVIYGQGVCVTAYHGRLGCFDVVSGSAYWAKKFSSKVGVSIDEQYVYAVDSDDKVYAFSNVRGESVWRNDKMTFRGLSTPVSYKGEVVVGDAEGYLHFLSHYDGSFDARIRTDGSAIRSAPIVVGDHLIVQTADGSLQAFTLQ